jgi:hypothetical protein
MISLDAFLLSFALNTYQTLASASSGRTPMRVAIDVNVAFGSLSTSRRSPQPSTDAKFTLARASPQYTPVQQHFNSQQRLLNFHCPTTGRLDPDNI